MLKRQIKPLTKGKDRLYFAHQLGENDVLLGRGTGPNENQGNIKFRALVKDHLAESPLRKNDGKAKTALATKIVRAVKAKKGRFLQRVNRASKTGKDFFVVVEEKVALEKTKQSFRHQIRSFTGFSQVNGIKKLESGSSNGIRQAFARHFGAGNSPETASVDDAMHLLDLQKQEKSPAGLSKTGAAKPYNICFSKSVKNRKVDKHEVIPKAVPKRSEQRMKTIRDPSSPFLPLLPPPPRQSSAFGDTAGLQLRCNLLECDLLATGRVSRLPYRYNPSLLDSALLESLILEKSLRQQQMNSLSNRILDQTRMTAVLSPRVVSSKVCIDPLLQPNLLMPQQSSVQTIDSLSLHHLLKAKQLTNR